MKRKNPQHPRNDMNRFRMNPILMRLRVVLAVLAVLWVAVAAQAQQPAVSNVVVSPTPGEFGKVRVTYDLANGGSLGVASWAVGLSVSGNGGATYDVPVNSVIGAVGSDVLPGAARELVWNAVLDWPRQVASRMRVRVTAWDKRLNGVFFVPIPAGNFVIGNQSGDEDLAVDAPVTRVGLRGFFMQTMDVTRDQWVSVQSQMSAKGYAGLGLGLAKQGNHPVHSVSWYEAITWANLASELEGLMPCYTLSNGSVIKDPSNAQLNAGSIVCNWSSNGYRLPTEAEWEVAARGGQVAGRFPWGGANRISSEQANYTGDTTSFAYDEGFDGPNPAFDDGIRPLTSPVGSFAANGYGLFDMSGNVSQWCWDVYAPGYAGGTQPTGPAGPGARVVRGGNWEQPAGAARCAKRGSVDPSAKIDTLGFRVVRGRP